MDKIELLLSKLGHKIPQSIANKIDKLDDFEEKLVLAEKDFEQESTSENKEILDEINDFVLELEADIISNLERLVSQKEAKEKELKEKELKEKENIPPINTSDKEKQNIEKKDNQEDNPEPKDKKGISIFGVALGVLLLVGTAGAYNYFSKNK